MTNKDPHAHKMTIPRNDQRVKKMARTMPSIKDTVHTTCYAVDAEAMTMTTQDQE